MYRIGVCRLRTDTNSDFLPASYCGVALPNIDTNKVNWYEIIKPEPSF